MKKVELLAPAGNFEALKGAVKAGADAVYLGGELYGARAYADNFTRDEICAGIHLAHVFGRKIYLTVNTLIKEKEFDGLYDFLLPFHEEGLDGVIIQDLGVLRYLKACFPGLALHASTQMTITGSRGAAFVKEAGISRIVPARELSLEEIKKIKSETGVEIEAFIHGAMCYCYSGQCLFSSILGGRSGNRGRCAQPCRLPYEVEGKKQCYPLSMRDMCTIELLPDLIAAGIDSFKIEGRMKKPAYAAGVTAIYRKYIDLYYADKENYRVMEEDRDILNALYIRSETGDGYYRKHNGREMISLASPAYCETDAGLLARIEKTYINDGLCRQVDAEVQLEPEKPALLTLQTKDTSVTCRGAVVQEAWKQPLSEEKIVEQIKKSGNSLLKLEQIKVRAEDAVFLPVRALNELRRAAIAAMEDELIRQNGLSYADRKAAGPDDVSARQYNPAASGNQSPHGRPTEVHNRGSLHAIVRTTEQLEAACEGRLPRIYLDYSLLEGESIHRLEAYKANAKEKELQFYLASPYVVRERDIKYLKKMEEALKTGLFAGVLIRNLESYQFFHDKNFSKNMVLDASLYIWNREALSFWEGRAREFYLPLECNVHEWRELLGGSSERKIQASAVVYGRLPMMVSANCIEKTMGKCSKMPGVVLLKDRYKKQFPVYRDCLCCYNVLYNSVPLSLHRFFSEKKGLVQNCRLDFTIEDKKEVLQVIRYFNGILDGYGEPFYKEFTTAHYKRGVE